MLLLIFIFTDRNFAVRVCDIFRLWQLSLIWHSCYHSRSSVECGCECRQHDSSTSDVVCFEQHWLLPSDVWRVWCEPVIEWDGVRDWWTHAGDQLLCLCSSMFLSVQWPRQQYKQYRYYEQQRCVNFSRCRFYWHCPHSMRSRVCVVVLCLSICLSVPAWAHGSKLTEHCRLAAVGLAGRRYQLLHGRHSAVTVGECRQCHIVSVRRKLNTDLFFFFICCCLCIFGACSWLLCILLPHCLVSCAMCHI